MHFNNIAIFKFERANHNLKNQLDNFIDDVRSIIKNFDVLCDRQRDDYQRVIDKAKQRLSHNFKKFLYRDFQTFVTSFVLKIIDEHYKRLLNAQKNNINLSHCTSAFKRIMKLFCVHIIEQRLIDSTSDEILKLRDVHFH